MQVSLCSVWWLTQELTPSQSSERAAMEVSGKDGASISYPPLKAQGSTWKVDRETVAS